MESLKARLIEEGRRRAKGCTTPMPKDLLGVLDRHPKSSLEAVLRRMEALAREAYSLGFREGISRRVTAERERTDGDIISFATSPFIDFLKIVVIGPQRSGTRFAAYALSEDLLYHFADQTAIGLTNFGLMKKVLDQHDRVVVQGTGCTAKIHELNRKDVLVVWVRRNTADVLASQKRIHWPESCERPRIPKPYCDVEPLCEGRYQYWNEVQKLSVPHWIEIDYESLRKHPLFVDRETRWSHRGGKGFGWNQSKL